MKEYMADIFTEKIANEKGVIIDCLVSLEIVNGKTPIQAARSLSNNARKAKQYENPDFILTEIWENEEGFLRHGKSYCYMNE